MTEVVYRLYETVDELSSVIENARSVPMSGGSCMVSRDILRSGIDSALLGLGHGSVHDLSPSDLLIPDGFARRLGA